VQLLLVSLLLAATPHVALILVDDLLTAEGF